MGNSAVIAWGERQAFSSHKRKAAFHKDQMPPLAFHVAISFSSCEASPPTTKVGWRVSPNFLILSVLNLGVWVLFFPSSWGRLSAWAGGCSIQCVFSGASNVTRVRWQELLMGLGAAQWPVTTVDQLGAPGTLSLPLQIDKATQDRKGQTKPNQKPSWRGKFLKNYL